MKRDYRKTASAALGRDMEMLVFGDRGLPVVVFAEELLAFVDDVLDPLDSRKEVEYLRVLAREGTSADRQLRVLKETGHLHKVVDALALETVRGGPEVALA